MGKLFQFFSIETIVWGNHFRSLAQKNCMEETSSMLQHRKLHVEIISVLQHGNNCIGALFQSFSIEKLYRGNQFNALAQKFCMGIYFSALAQKINSYGGNYFSELTSEICSGKLFIAYAQKICIRKVVQCLIRS